MNSKDKDNCFWRFEDLHSAVWLNDVVIICVKLFIPSPISVPFAPN